MNEEEKPTVLAADDNQDALYALERILLHNGYQVICASSGDEALEKALASNPSAAVLDVVMPGLSGFELAQRFKENELLRFVPVILVTARDSLEDVISGLERGADDYVVKPFQPEELLARLKAALRLRSIYQELHSSQEQNRKLLGQLSARYDFSNIVGESTAMREVCALIEKIAVVDSSVLITGPTGSGKELVARAIHFSSGRKNRPFVAKNCAAFNENLLESELFGHMKGAFTGAIRDQGGLFATADQGSLFLDEIGEMTAALQAKLLRVLQDGVFMPVGSTQEKKANVRVIAATNRNLSEMVEGGVFREDLYFRLNVINVHVPPLVERREDIPLLIEHFLKQMQERIGVKPKRISNEALQVLNNCKWRGNVREVENEIERMLILGRDNDELGVELISPRLLEEAGEEIGTVRPERGVLKEAIEDIERELIAKTLRRLNWNKSVASKELGISRSSLITKVKQYRLEKP